MLGKKYILRNSTSYLGGETIREQYETVYNQALNCVVRVMRAIGIQRTGTGDYGTTHSMSCRQSRFREEMSGHLLWELIVRLIWPTL